MALLLTAARARLIRKSVLAFLWMAPVAAFAQQAGNDDPFGFSQAQAQPDAHKQEAEVDPTAVQDALLQLKRELERLSQASMALTERTAVLGETATQQQSRLVLRLYDVADLFTFAPAYPARGVSDLLGDQGPYFPTSSAPASTVGFAAGGMGGGMAGGMGGAAGQEGGFFDLQSRPTPGILPQASGGLGGATSHASAASNGPLPTGPSGPERITIDDLIDAIVTAIAPDTWDSVGGEGSISTLGNALLVRNTPDVHDQISNLLALCRKKWGHQRTVTVQAVWLWQTPQMLDQLAEYHAQVSSNEADGQPCVVPESLWTEWTVGPAGDERVAYRGVVTGFSGQTVHLSSGRQTIGVAQVIPVVGNGAVAYTQRTKMLHLGAVVQVTPIVNPKGTHATVDVHGRLQQPVDSPPEAPAVHAFMPTPTIDRPVLKVHQVSSTVRVPLGRFVQVGGSVADQVSDEPAMVLYVRADLNELSTER